MATVEQLKVKIVSVEAAIEAVMLSQEYTYDTGMTVQKVKRADLPSLQSLLNFYESQLSVKELQESDSQITRGIAGRIDC